MTFQGFFLNRCCSVQLAPVLTAVSCDPGSTDPNIRGLSSRPPVQDPDLRPALCCHLLSQVRPQSLSVHLVSLSVFCPCFVMTPLCVCVIRVLCETVKDFVARVGKAYEKNTESSEESEAMAKKVSLYLTWLATNTL